MKKNILLLIAIIAILSIECAGQDAITIRFGQNMARLRGDQTESFIRRSGIAFGSSLVYNTSPQLSLEFEILYQENGYKIKANERFHITRLDYYNMGLFLKRTTDDLFDLPIKNVLFYAHLGPVVSLLVYDDRVSDYYYYYRRNNAQFIDLSISLGLGFSYSINAGSLNFETRHARGFVNVYPERQQKNSTWTFLLGYKINMNDLIKYSD